MDTATGQERSVTRETRDGKESPCAGGGGDRSDAALRNLWGDRNLEMAWQGPSPEANTFTSGFQPPELRDNTFLLL